MKLPPSWRRPEGARGATTTRIGGYAQPDPVFRLALDRPIDTAVRRRRSSLSRSCRRLTGAIGRVARFVPQSVSVGLQLGLGMLMAALGIELMLKTPWLGIGALGHYSC
jgi:hypothetical protein